MPRPIQDAALAAAAMMSGLMSYKAGNPDRKVQDNLELLTAHLENRATPVLDLWQDLADYAVLSAELVNRVAGGDDFRTVSFPGVYAYEVEEEFGREFMHRIDESGDLHEEALKPALGELAHGFFTNAGADSLPATEAIIKELTGYTPAPPPADSKFAGMTRAQILGEFGYTFTQHEGHHVAALIKDDFEIVAIRSTCDEAERAAYEHLFGEVDHTVTTLPAPEFFTLSTSKEPK